MVWLELGVPGGFALRRATRARLEARPGIGDLNANLLLRGAHRQRDLKGVLGPPVAHAVPPMEHAVDHELTHEQAEALKRVRVQAALEGFESPSRLRHRSRLLRQTALDLNCHSQVIPPAVGAWSTTQRFNLTTREYADHFWSLGGVKKHGIALVERYDAGRCFNFPDDTVAEFLKLLRR